MNEREKDELGRKLVISKLASSGLKFKYKPTKDDFDAIDLILNINNRNFYCEIKYRSTYNYTDFEDSILEHTKLKRIMNNYSEKEGGILYIVLWKDNVLEIFDLRSIKKMLELGKVSLISKSMRKNNNGYERINKDVILLKHKLSIKTLY